MLHFLSSLVSFRSLDDYFTNALGKKIHSATDINENDIAKSKNVEEITRLVELIVGVAVFCDNKQIFIGKIFELSADSQTVLKGMVQNVMVTAEDIGGEEDEENEEEEAVVVVSDSNNGTGVEEITFDTGANAAAVHSVTSGSSSHNLANEELLRTREMLQHMTQERSKLLSELSSLETQNDSLKAQLARSQSHPSGPHSPHGGGLAASAVQQQLLNAEDIDDYKQRTETAENNVYQLRRELEETKSILDQRLQEVETLRQEQRMHVQRLEAAKVLQAKAEMEARATSDELDLSRAKAERLHKAEQQLEKAQKRLEEMLVLKKTNKELNDRLDDALDKIHDLESSSKELVTLQKHLDTARAKNIEFERQLFEAQSLSQSLEEQVGRLRDDVWRTSEKQRAAEDEVRNLRQQLELSNSSGLNEDQDASTLPGEEDDEGDDFSGNVTVLRQKLREKSRQLKALQRQQQQSSEATDASAASEATNVSSGALLALQQELEDVKRSKKEREEQYHLLRRQLQESENARDTLNRQLADRDHVSTNASRDTAQRVQVLSATVQRLEERLKERELQVTRLETEKNKLETYAKRSLTTFKEKFMSVLQTMREEKKELEAKVKAQAERTEKNQEAWRREERLLSAALFEVGVKIMDRSIHAGLSSSSVAPSTTTTPFQGGESMSSSAGFLTAQREAVGRSALVHSSNPANSNSSHSHVPGPSAEAAVLSPEPASMAARRLFAGQQTPSSHTNM